MRKILTSILALALACTLPLTALGATVTGSTVLPSGMSISLSSTGSLETYTSQDGYLMYQLVNAAGEPFTAPYYRITSLRGHLSTFIAGTGQDDTGVLNCLTGEIILPAAYTDIEACSDQWIVGIRLKPNTVPKSSGPLSFFTYTRSDILDADVYFGSQKIATLTADEWGSYSVFGRYLLIRNDTNAIALSPSGEKHVADRSMGYSEFHENYSTDVITHVPTGQEAFVPGCSLTAAEVDKAYWMNDAGIVDLQGNVILAREAFPHEDLYLNDSHGDYLLISYEDEETSEDLYGVMDKTGKIIIPCELTELPYLSCEDPWFVNGTLAATTPTHLNFYDAAGTVLTSVDLTAYGADASSVNNLRDTIISIDCSDGSTIYASAAHGVLDTSAYEEIYDSYSDALLNVKQNDRWGIMDQNGELIIPCIHQNVLTITDDATMAQGTYYDEADERYSVLYTIEH